MAREVMMDNDELMRGMLVFILEELPTCKHKYIVRLILDERLMPSDLVVPANLNIDETMLPAILGRELSVINIKGRRNYINYITNAPVDALVEIRNTIGKPKKRYKHEYNAAGSMINDAIEELKNSNTTNDDIKKCYYRLKEIIKNNVA